jgi:hypothetical protein
LVENRFKEFKKDPTTAKDRMKEYLKKMVNDVFVRVDVPAWLTDNNVLEHKIRKAYENFAVALMSFKERKFRRWLL